MPASVTTIASFPTSTGNGTDPDGQLFIDSNGDLRGATVHGGANGIGTTYEIAKIAGGYATTPTFLADIPTGLNTLLNGRPEPERRCEWRPFRPGVYRRRESLGAVVEFPAAAADPATLATTFTGGAGGSNPGGRLLVDASGNLFGTTLSGGANGAGTVFEVKKRAASTRARQPSSPASAPASRPLARATWSKTRRATFSAPPPARCLRFRRRAPAMPLRLASSPSRWGHRSAL